MISIPKIIISKINDESEKAYPNECCGIILGLFEENGNKKAVQAVSMENSREDSEKYHRFLITPEDMAKAELRARKLNLDILGFYHSHPDCKAKPSDFDREHALPCYSYLITSVENAKVTDLTSWELSCDRDTFNNEKITEE
jgi:proteasome lid subunit RPN8/RPN11